MKDWSFRASDLSNVSGSQTFVRPPEVFGPEMESANFESAEARSGTGGSTEVSVCWSAGTGGIVEVVLGAGSGCGVLPKVEISWIWAIRGSEFGVRAGVGCGWQTCSLGIGSLMGHITMEVISLNLLLSSRARTQ